MSSLTDHSRVRARQHIATTLLVFLLGLGGFADAEIATERFARSVDIADGSADSPARKAALLDAQLALEQAAALVTAGGRREASAAPLDGRRQIAAVPAFRIFDARSFLFDDFDHDGFFSRFSISFDADVDHGFAEVYARLYLSLAGGPWNLYHTTDVFGIQADSDRDDFEVVTELMSGYPSGHYDVLIELYLIGLPAPVAVFGPYQDVGLLALPLESSHRDEPFIDRYEDGYGHGAAAIGTPLSGLLAGLGAWRFARRRMPRVVPPRPAP